MSLKEPGYIIESVEDAIEEAKEAGFEVIRSDPTQANRGAVP